MNPYDKAHELAQTIRESSAYEQMKALKEKLEADESAKKMLMDFQNKQIELERKHLLGGSITEDEQEVLRQLYEILQIHTVARDYLAAEMQIGILYQDISRIIGDVIQEASILSPELTGLDPSEA